MNRSTASFGSQIHTYKDNRSLSKNSVKSALSISYSRERKRTIYSEKPAK